MSTGCWHNLRVVCDRCLQETPQKQITGAVKKQSIGTCVCCRARGVVLTRDHIVPKLWLREHGLTQGFGGHLNKQMLCFPCNKNKGSSAIDYRGDKDKYDALVHLMYRQGITAHIKFRQKQKKREA